MFHICSRPYYKKTRLKSTDEEAEHMVNILEKTIQNLDQVQGVSEGYKRK